MLQRIILTTALFSAFSMSHAELSDLTESELSDVSGEGIALVFEDFQIEMLWAVKWAMTSKSPESKIS